MPQFTVPDGESEDSWLVKEVERGLVERFKGQPVPETHRKQAEYEVSVMCQMGFPGYFLVTADLVRYAKQEGIRVGPGRGRAGSIVAWAMGITELDPIKHGLLFERFLNPERVSMPDIDMDFDERRRGDMIRYATAKYGSERVAQIVTYGSIKAKAAIKDSARVLECRMPWVTRSQGNATSRYGQGCSAVRHLRLQTPALLRAGSFAIYMIPTQTLRKLSTRPKALGPQAPAGCTPLASS